MGAHRALTMCIIFDNRFLSLHALDECLLLQNIIRCVYVHAIQY